MRKIRVKTICLFIASCLVNAAGAAQPAVDAVDWPAFLAEQDMHWSRLPGKWFEGPFLGDGEQGTLMYKLACATRDKGWIIDNQGPWLQFTAWPALWWNLNVQLSHSGGYTANRRGMVSAMSHRLDINRDNLALNIAEPFRADSYRGAQVKRDGNGIYSIETSPDDWVLFWLHGKAWPKPSVIPVAPHGEEHHFGL